MSEENNPKYVTIEFCNERFGRMMDKLTEIDRKLTELREAQSQSIRDWKLFALSIFSGVIVAIVSWILARI
jgi:pheromone shutdown protein TraB